MDDMKVRSMNNNRTVIQSETYLVAGITSEEPLLTALSRHEDCRVRRRVAENPNTPPSVLARLCNDVDSEVRMAVSEHPLTSTDLLEWLATDEDADVRFGLAENANVPSRILLVLSEDENPFVSMRALKTLGRLSFEATACAFIRTGNGNAQAAHDEMALYAAC